MSIRPYDIGKVEDASLIIYSPVRVRGVDTIVANGDHADTVYDYLSSNRSFEDALRSRRFEPDAPHFTPRISGLMHVDGGKCAYRLHIIKSANGACLRQSFEYEPQAGLGHLIHTYAGDGEPLPSYMGEPAAVALSDSADTLGEALWAALDPRYKVALFVRQINLATGGVQTRVYNRHAL